MPFASWWRARHLLGLGWHVATIVDSSMCGVYDFASSRLIRDVIVLNGARLGAVALTVALVYFGGRLVGVDVPLFVSMMCGLGVALAASASVLRPLRKRVNDGIAAVDAERNVRDSFLQ